jgi:septin 6/8/11
MNWDYKYDTSIFVLEIYNVLCRHTNQPHTKYDVLMFHLVENETHCDFTKLREMLLRVNMEDLREKTHYQHYELYRKKRLEEMGFEDNTGLSEVYEQKRKEHFQEMQAKEEHMRQMFVQKVKEKEAELKLAEQKLHDEFEKLRRQHSEQKAVLEGKRRELETEVKDFNVKKSALQAQRAHNEREQLARTTPTTKKK